MEGHSKVRDKMQHLKQRLRPEGREAVDYDRTTSYQETTANPDKVGWLQYRIVNFWHKGFFKLHGHYLTYLSDEAGKPAGVINLWNVQGIVLDNTDLRLTLNEKALKRHGVRHLFAPHGMHGEPIIRLRATDPQTAQEWLEAMQQSAVEGEHDTLSRNSSMHGPITEEGWLVQRIQLQDGDGSPLHTVNALVDSDAAVHVLLGSRVEPTQALRVEVAMVGPRGEQATGTQPLRLTGPQGSLHVPVQLGVGKATCDVCLAWETESAEEGEAGLALRLPGRTKQAVAVAGAAALVALLVSLLLGVAVAGVGVYWLLARGPGPSTAVDCFIARFTVEPTRRSAGAAVPVISPRTAPKASPRSIPVASPRTPLQPSSSSRAPTFSDQSISREELQRLTELRAALTDLQAPESGVSAAVYEKHVSCDYRLVRYLRARPTIAAAADMVRESLRWRTSFGADTILQTFWPEPWMLKYFGSGSFSDCLEQGRDRFPCYQRDREGHFTLFWRGGFVDWKTAYQALNSNLDYVTHIFVWVFELLREDMEKLHEQTRGASPSYITFVYDLEGFEYGNQVPVSTLLAVAQRLFGLLNLNYPETIHRILIVRAPWLFSSLWAVLKPLIPKELLEKMPLSGGGKLSKVVQNLTHTVPPNQIPKFLGGTLVDADGDEECRYTVGPSGPFLHDKGRALLQEGINHPVSAPSHVSHQRPTAGRTTRRHAGSTFT
eukprot:GGOE01021611.1.p1 GENE.GGOE01021611.1~~GGOE01021611.1.p1  ORF type:complete len:717 (-),score=190.05 GGOE01021611.1:260-2410(-)